MKRIVFVVTAAALLAFSSPASAHGGHTSCKAFGNGVGELAQSERPFGQSVVRPGPADEGIRGFQATFCQPGSQ
jgi:hypothetical protein